MISGKKIIVLFIIIFGTLSFPTYIGSSKVTESMPRYDRHFVGITRYFALSWMAKICRVIQIKLNQLVKENVHVITDLTIKRIQALSQWQTFSEFLPTYLRRRQNQLA